MSYANKIHIFCHNLFRPLFGCVECLKKKKEFGEAIKRNRHTKIEKQFDNNALAVKL